MISNPVIYFEIPVYDLQRAAQFYTKLLDFHFQEEVIDGYAMAIFPFNDNARGISGTLAKGDAYTPSKNGIILYFYTSDIDDTLARAQRLGSNIIYPKTYNATYACYVAEIEDSEGNRIALQQHINDV